MKSFAICIATALLLLTAVPVSFASQRAPVTLPAPNPPLEPAAAQLLIDRLTEIKQTKKRGMDAEERKALRQEKAAIKTELRSGGVYVSVGVLLLVIILLILLL